MVREHGRHADVLELRADFLDPAERPAAVRLPRNVGVPVILTVRRVRDGGAFSADEEERAALLERLLGGGFALTDIEEDFSAKRVDDAAAAAGTGIIRSLHDFSGVPQHLFPRLSRLARTPREIPKAAVMPRGSADLTRLLGVFSESRGMRKVLLGMGEYGMCTRILAGRLGSLLCYTSPPGATAAPGHVDPETLTSLYNFKSIVPPNYPAWV